MQGTPDHELHVGDLPRFDDVLTDADGNPVDLSGATIRFVMRPAAGGAAKIATAAVNDDAGLPTRGHVHYQWTGTNSDTAGDFYAVWEATMSAQPVTYPSGPPMLVRIWERLG